MAMSTKGVADDRSSRRRARDRCIDGAVRESGQFKVGVEVQERRFARQKQQPRPGDPVLAHLPADDRLEVSGATHTSRAAGGAWAQQ